ncbi:T9SS type B sorting domain-containing protein [Portibacter lacus]|nr:gliding motility-associated C-terminal domain-containing protein [Portibacter lacus]
MRLKVHFLFFFILSSIALKAQFGVPLNDNCSQSIKLTQLENFCSDDVDLFSTEGATIDTTEGFGCQTSFQPLGVWYNFTAITKFVRITVEGEDAGNGLLLTEPIIGIYEGGCGNLNQLNCVTTATGVNVAEIVITTVPGKNYTLMIGAKNNSQGSFRLCLNSFNVDPEPLQDCGQARILCDKSPIGVESVVGFGSIRDDLDLGSNPAIQFPACGVVEDASNWYKWTCDQPGTLEFTITPLKQFDDIDFVVYEFPDGLENCNTKVLIRNMISGENQGQNMNQWAVCVGPTGLISGDGQDGESCGCQNGDNNFANAIQMEAGKSYGLMVMNFSQSGVGYNLDFGGTGTFAGPVPEFSIEPITGLRCDQAFTIEDRSRDNGNPLTYEWYFGEDATPETSTEAGPFDVNYTTFGQKYIVLTVKDQVNGCEVTEIFDIFAEACCEDIDPLVPTLVNAVDPTCPNFSDGSLELAASGGSNSGYTFSINGSPFVSGSEFMNLPDGTFNIDVIDDKGCEGSIDLNLFDPDSIIVNAGLDSLIDLGDMIDLEGEIVSDNGRDYDIVWTWNSNGTEVSCVNCLDPNVFPFGATTFTLTAIDEFGCEFSDRVAIDVDLNYPLYIPNVFSPNDDGFNDRFTAFGGIAVQEIALLKIFDRWGNLVYEERNFPISDTTFGWDGMFNNSLAEPGVYTYIFDIQFIDNNPPREYSGDITLLR